MTNTGQGWSLATETTATARWHSSCIRKRLARIFLCQTRLWLTGIGLLLATLSSTLASCIVVTLAVCPIMEIALMALINGCRSVKF